MSEPIEVRLLGAREASVLERVAPGVFDHDVRPTLVREFLSDPRHHLAVALASGEVVGMASAVHYIHPDKPPELWVNEVGVTEAYRRRGLATRLLAALFERARALGCSEAWVLAEPDNEAACRLYENLPCAGPAETAVAYGFDLTAARDARPSAPG